MNRDLLDSRTGKSYLQVHKGEQRPESQLSHFAFNDREVLPNAGNVSKKAAEEHARQEYERFAERRREYKEALGEGESIKALEEAAKQLGLGEKKVEGGE